MANVLVGYDLNSPGKDYQPLLEHLRSYPNWWHWLDSTWIVVTSLSAIQVRDACLRFMDANDEILVVDITGDPAAWFGFPARGSQWLKSQL